jgi:hypothetical protein
MTVITDEVTSIHHLQTWATIHSTKHHDSQNNSELMMQTELELSTEIRDAVRLRCQWSPAHTCCAMFQHLQCKQYTYQRGIKHSNNTAEKKIGTTMWEIINRSPDLMTITDYSQNIIIYCEVCSLFSVIHMSSPSSH